MTDKQRVLDLIAVKGGTDIYKVMNATGLNYSEVIRCIKELEKDGRIIKGTSAGNQTYPSQPYLKAIFLSKTDPQYHDLIK